MGRSFKQLTSKQRIQIKEMLDQGFSKSEIADRMKVHNSTIYREIKRGSINGKYDPIYSENLYRLQMSEKGVKSNFTTNPELGKYVADLILKKKLSVLQVIETLEKGRKFESFPTTSTTIYSAIDNGLIPGVTRENLRSDTTTVFSDGNIHIAKWIRELLNLKDGDELRVTVIGNKIVFSKKNNPKI